jgi:hypothetical protein
LPVAGFDVTGQTHAIGRFIPLLDGIDIQGRGSIAEALLTQRKLATYWMRRQAREVAWGSPAALQHQPNLVYHQHTS